MGSVFKFKQFEVDQRGCAMKINTDGVLLAAVATHPAPLQILDIGTGTGVIALMLAQRFEKAIVDAVEIDVQAAAAAEVNFKASPFAERTAAHPVAFEKFEPAIKYDLIVSNPPYFINDLKSQEKRKEVARHTHEDFFDLMLRKAAAMLTENGLIWLILPVAQADRVVVNAVLYQLYPVKMIHIYSDQTKTAFRHIIALGFIAAKPLVHDHVYIYEAKDVYTEQYKSLLSDFFLAF